MLQRENPVQKYLDKEWRRINNTIPSDESVYRQSLLTGRIFVGNKLIFGPPVPKGYIINRDVGILETVEPVEEDPENPATCKPFDKSAAEVNADSYKAAIIGAPNCVKSSENVSGEIDIGPFGIIGKGELDVATTSSEGCQSFAALLQTYQQAVCNITKITSSALSFGTQGASTSQTITMNLTNVNCESIIAQNTNTIKMLFVSSATDQTKIDVANDLKSSMKSITDQAVKTVVDGYVSPEAQQIIDGISAEVNNLNYTDIVSEMFASAQQLYQSSQNIDVTIDNSGIINSRCKSLILKNTSIVEMMLEQTTKKALDVVVQNKVIMDSLKELIIAVDNQYTGAIPSDNTTDKLIKAAVPIAIAIGAIIVIGIAISAVSKSSKEKKQANANTPALETKPTKGALETKSITAAKNPLNDMVTPMNNQVYQPPMNNQVYQPPMNNQVYQPPMNMYGSDFGMNNQYQYYNPSL